jgi:hypothetical protein
MKSQDVRVSKLEKQSGGDGKSIYVSQADGRVLVDGELLSEDELKSRYPDIDIVRVGINMELI